MDRGAPPGPENCTVGRHQRGIGKNIRQALGPISTGPLSALLRLHGRPINLVVYQGPYSLKGMGELISRWASRLDAFSGYPVRT